MQVISLCSVIGKSRKTMTVALALTTLWTMQVNGQSVQLTREQVAAMPINDVINRFMQRFDPFLQEKVSGLSELKDLDDARRVRDEIKLVKNEELEAVYLRGLSDKQKVLPDLSGEIDLAKGLLLERQNCMNEVAREVMRGQKQGGWKLVEDGGIKVIRDDSLHKDEKTGKDKSVGGIGEFNDEGSTTSEDTTTEGEGSAEGDSTEGGSEGEPEASVGCRLTITDGRLVLYWQ